MAIVDSSGKAVTTESPIEGEAAENIDQILRENIPSIDDLDTLYRPFNSQIMVIPLKAITRRGRIIIPDQAQTIINEGHVVALGPLLRNDPNALYCEIGIGDCVAWSQHTETRYETDGRAEFLLIEPHSITLIIKHDALIESARIRAGGEPAKQSKR